MRIRSVSATASARGVRSGCRHRGWAASKSGPKGGGLGAGRIDRGAAASLVAACCALIPALPAGSDEFGLVVPAITASALATVLALVLGSRAKARIERSRGFLRGRALATAGIVLGWIEVAAWILSPFIAGLVVWWSTRNCPSPCL